MKHEQGISKTNRIRALRDARVAEGHCYKCDDLLGPDRAGKRTCKPCNDKEHQRRIQSADKYAAYKANLIGHHHRIRNEALELYGARCTCCQEAHREFLNFHHTKGDGADHREMITGKKREGGHRFYAWLNSHPRIEDIQLLCWNCHFAMHHGAGVCPHARDQTN